MPEQSMRISPVRRHDDESARNSFASPPAHSRSFTESLSRGLELLRCFSPSKPALSNKELALLTGLPKPTVTRLTYTMVELGFMRKVTDSRKFQLGSAALAISYPMLASLPIRQVVHKRMQLLADHTSGAVGLFLCDRLDMVCIDATRHFNAAPTLLDIGATSPLWAGSEGWASLASLPPPLRTERLHQIRQAHPGPDTEQIDRIQRAIDSVATFGYCVSRDPATDNCHISVPMRTADNSDPMVITCAITSAMAKDGWVEQDIGPRLVTTVNNLNHSLA